LPMHLQAKPRTPKPHLPVPDTTVLGMHCVNLPAATTFAAVRPCQVATPWPSIFCCRYGLKHKYDHLVCFVPGMLALGAHSGAVTGAKAER